MPVKPTSNNYYVGGWNWRGDDGARPFGGLSAAIEPRRGQLLSDRFDGEQLIKWAEALGVTPELNRLLAGEIKPKRT